MHEQHAGAHMHLCLPVPQAPAAPCHCLPPPGACPQALHQNPRRLPAAPAGNTSGATAENTHKPLQTMYRLLGHKQAPPFPCNFKCEVLRNLASAARKPITETANKKTLMARPCIPDHARGLRFVKGRNAAGSEVIRRRGHGAKLVLQTRAMVRLPVSERETHVAATMPSTYSCHMHLRKVDDHARERKVCHMPCTLALAALPLHRPAQHVRKYT